MLKIDDRNKGFTMAELLVVVAIIAVLVAIAIPVFSSQLKNARLAVDHSAMRDAYAVVQVANNAQEVVIDGKVWTFDQLDRDLEGVSMLYCLTKDCSSLVSALQARPDVAYTFLESAEDSSGICKTCGQWDNTRENNDILQPSKSHKDGYYIYITYKKDTHQLYLGWSFG